jgi:outer membrane protein assembly factor BamD
MRLLKQSSWISLGLVAGLLCTGCFGGKKTAKVVTPNSNSAEPDKLLYEKSMDDIKHGRLTVARLELQTLLNTYPDSEYQAKAKLAIADSYYKEGGPTGLTQSIAEYQDFITFFPFLDEAAYAQSQVAMAHFRAMEKPDRDRNEALEAEGAFQTYLQKYPDNPLHPQMEQRLREVQEVLAEGDYRVANFYYIREAYRPAALRLTLLIDRYPLYSQADKANWMLASIYERTEHNEFAAVYYSRIVKNYPLSPLAEGAKAKLKKFGMPVPQADPTALARMKTEQNTPRERSSLITRPLGVLKNGPDVKMAARTGTPTLTPEEDGGGLTFGTGAITPAGSTVIGGAGGTSAAPAANTGTGAFVETVSPGSAPASDAAPASTAPAASDAASAPAAPSNGSAAPADASGAAPAASSTTSTSSTTSSTSSTSTDSSANSQSESSSSKKKKGLKKLNPF